MHGLDETESAVLATVAQFTDRDVRPVARELEHANAYPEALIARVFVGMGDAMTFICVLRLVSAWFSPRRIPLVTQLTGNIGQLGALIAAVPMTWALSHLGWHTAYLTAAAAGPVMLVPLLIFMRDTPQALHHRGTALSLPDLGRSIRASWAQPGTRLGFWVHFTTPFSATMLALLWGYPFFVKGEHLSDGAAGSLLSLIVVANIVAGPVLGWLVGRHPWHRSSLALMIVAAIVVSWTAVLLWPGHAPYWLLAITVFIAGAGGPGSMIGFDVGRTSNPGHRLASASGIINVAGFVAALITIVAVGLILDWRTPGGGTDYTDGAFHWAMSFQYILWALGIVMILRQRRQVRAQVERDAVNAGDSMVRPAI